jgi:hypothetical protein
MTKLDFCDRCRFYARSPYLVCADHPAGVEEDICSDFALDVETPDDEATAWYGERWHPEGASYYGGELVLDPARVRSQDEQLHLLDTHPLFTGRCPNCEMPLLQTDPPRVHWDCRRCGWVDDSV